MYGIGFCDMLRLPGSKYLKRFDLIQINFIINKKIHNLENGENHVLQLHVQVA